MRNHTQKPRQRNDLSSKPRKKCNRRKAEEARRLAATEQKKSHVKESLAKQEGDIEVSTKRPIGEVIESFKSTCPQSLGSLCAELALKKEEGINTPTSLGDEFAKKIDPETLSQIEENPKKWLTQRKSPSHPELAYEYVGR